MVQIWSVSCYLSWLEYSSLILLYGTHRQVSMRLIQTSKMTTVLKVESGDSQQRSAWGKRPRKCTRMNSNHSLTHSSMLQKRIKACLKDGSQLISATLLIWLPSRYFLELEERQRCISSSVTAALSPQQKLWLRTKAAIFVGVVVPRRKLNLTGNAYIEIFVVMKKQRSIKMHWQSSQRRGITTWIQCVTKKSCI